VVIKSFKNVGMSRPRLIALLLALLTMAVYLPVTNYDFLSFDDDEYVTDNLAVLNGLTPAGIRWAFTTFHAANWHPLTWLSHMTDCEFFGLNAGAHHVVNILFHAANVALLFTLLFHLTQQIAPTTIVAALFAWHPLHVESVAWIAERKDVLSTFFGLLALLNYARFVKKSSRRSFWFTLLFFALSLMSKPMLVTLPFVMLLLDYWPLQRVALDRWQGGEVLRLVREKIPFFALSAMSCVVTFIAQHASHAVVTLNQEPLSQRIENSTVASMRYLIKTFWPADLVVIYPAAQIPAVTFILATVTLIFISLAVWFLRRRNPCWLIGWLWFLGTLVPVVGLVQVGGAAMADRYTYIPSIGIFIAVVFGLHDLAGKRPWLQKLYTFGVALPLIACVMLTERQLGYWRNSETLFRHAIAVTPNNVLARLDLGRTLDLQGRSVEALAEYRVATSLRPNHYQIQFAIGNLLEKMGRPAEALDEYRVCLTHNPEVATLHNSAGGALVALGRPNAALAEFAQAAQLDPRYVAPHLGAAKALLLQDRSREAINQFRAALRIEPDNFEILAGSAHVLAANEGPGIRDGQTALALALRSNKLSGGIQPMVLDILAMAYAETGDFTNAVTCAQNAVDLASQANLKSTEAIRQRLELYKHGQPWRESFRANAVPAQAK
jgi:tetratricopeptide (TPR) repeat protein